MRAHGVVRLWKIRQDCQMAIQAALVNVRVGFGVGSPPIDLSVYDVRACLGLIKTDLSLVPGREQAL